MSMNSRQRRKAKAHIAKHAEALSAAPSMISKEGNVRARKWSDALPDARVPHKWSSKPKKVATTRFKVDDTKKHKDYTKDGAPQVKVLNFDSLRVVAARRYANGRPMLDKG